MSNQQPYNLSLRDFFEAVFRHRRLAITFSLSVVLLGVLALLFFPRTYRSEAQIFLRVGRETVGMDPTADTGRTIALQAADRKDEIKSAIDVIKSRGVIAQAIDEVGADVVLGAGGDDAPSRNIVANLVSLPFRVVVALVQSIDPVSDRERAINLVERNLAVSADRGSTLINVEYDAKTPQLAQTVCSAIVDVYRREHIRIHRSDESRPFFEEQHERLRDQLDTSLEALRAAKNEMGLTDVEQRRATLESQYSAVELDRLVTQQQLATTRARVADLTEQVNALPERLDASRKTIPNSGADLLRQKLYDLQVKAMDLSARYKDTHPKVRAIKAQLAEAKKVMDEQAGERMEVTDDVNPIRRQLSLELKQEKSVLAGLQARLGELDHQQATLLSEQQSLNQNEMTIDRLSREADLARDSYFQYAKSLEETRIDKELQNERISNVSVVLAASASEKPVKPSKLLILLGTFLLATCGTATVVMGKERMSDELRSENDVARDLDLPVFGSIPGGRIQSQVLPVKVNGIASQEVGNDSNGR